MKEPQVVLVDDDRYLRESVQRALRREPYRLIAVSSAQECLEAIASAPIKVVVCDQQMPGIQGLDLLVHLRSIKPEIVRIILSGNVTLSTTLKAVNQCEVYRVLSKPCLAAELALAIRSAIDHYHIVAESRRLLELINVQSAYIRQIVNPAGNKSETLGVSSPAKNHDLESLITNATREVESLESLLKERLN